MQKTCATHLSPISRAWLSAWLLLLGQGALLGCENLEIVPDPMLRISGGRISQTIETLCILEVVDEVGLIESKPKLNRVEATTKRALKRLGFQVVGTLPIRGLLTNVNEKAGGYFDRHWGRVNVDRRKEIDEAFYARAAQSLKCDAIVRVAVVLVESPAWNGAAQWDHATTSFLAYTVTGHLDAISLRIVIQNMSGDEIYYGAGGVHLTSKIKVDEHHEPHLVSISPDRYLARDTEYTRAIRYALQELSESLATGTEDARRR